MSSKFIPYTYLIGWKKYNKWYYGRRTAKNCHPSELWVTYFTSSKYVKNFTKLHGNPDVIEIRKLFPNEPKKCSVWESKVLEKINVQHNDKWLNKKNGDYKWDTTGISLPLTEKTKEKIKNTLHLKYGVVNPSLSIEIKNKRKNTFLERYGVTNTFQTTIFLEKSKKTWMEKYGVDNPNKREIICKHCGRFMKIPHEKQCKLNPDRKTIDQSGANNSNAKIYIIEDPNGNVYNISGNYITFCKENNIHPRLLRKNKITKGWKLIN